ncbi:MAG: methylated-DNA--[protein]-cysteine S-methyltransferase [Chitinophagaceae bacterium]
MENNINIQFYKSKFGNLIIGSYQNKLVLCDWQFRKMRQAIDQRICNYFKASYKEKTDAIIDQTITELEQYFNKEKTNFTIPIDFAGSSFQINVWNELLKIEYGTTSTYLQQAEKLNNKEAIRAVAAANGANAISIIVPCHRIIGSDGNLVGYAGGLTVKEKLLELEGAIKEIKNNNQLKLEF